MDAVEPVGTVVWLQNDHRNGLAGLAIVFGFASLALLLPMAAHGELALALWMFPLYTLPLGLYALVLSDPTDVLIHDAGLELRWRLFQRVKVRVHPWSSLRQTHRTLHEPVLRIPLAQGPGVKIRLRGATRAGSHVFYQVRVNRTGMAFVGDDVDALANALGDILVAAIQQGLHARRDGSIRS